MYFERNDKNGIYAVVVAGVMLCVMPVLTVYAAQEQSQPAAVSQPTAAAEQSQSAESKTDSPQCRQPAAQTSPAVEPLAPQSLQTIAFKKDMPIKDALRMLAQMYQKNIVPSAKVDGVVTVTNLYDVTFEEALQAILGAHKYEIKGNFVRVYTNDEFKADKDRFEHAIFILNYINAVEAKKLLTPLLSEFGSIEATEAPKVEISSGDDLSVQEGGNSMSLQDSIVMRDYPEVITKAKSFIKQLDVKPLQVLVEATILSATLTEGLEFGVDLNLMAGTSLDGTAATETIVAGSTISRGASAQSPIKSISSVVNGTPMETAGFAKAGINGLRIGISSGDVRAIITALESITDITVLANPKILALNKQVGTVFIGQNIGYRSSTTVSGSGVATSGEVKFLKSGTKLSFRPYITDDGCIRMDIYPKDSSASKDADGVPTETTAELATNIMVKDGQTVVIGGLFRDSVTSSKRQIPLLGDIPLIGELFKGTSDQTVRQEVIVLITPHIISKPEQTDGAARLEDVRRLAYIARQNLTWMSRAKLDEQRYAKAVKLYDEGNLDAALSELETQEVWGIDRNYMDPVRLKERILREKQPDKLNQMERIMLGNLEKEESGKWLRR
jgi:type II secretory pathway component GspD/PulD (secretin)